MKIVVLDGYTENPGDLSWAPLETLGDVTIYDRVALDDEDEVIRRLDGAEIAVVNKAPVTRRVLESCPNLKLITVMATGYNVVDIACAKEKGIPVCNVPNYGGYSVSQFAIALMLEACLHIGHHDRTVHEGRWQNSQDWCYWDYPLIELAGKTYGLLGCGRIGIHTAEAAKGLGMHVIAYNRSRSQAAKDLGVEFVELDELFARSDVLGLQMPLMPFNTGIINKENIAKMKDGAVLLNYSRGGIVNDHDVCEALDSGKLRLFMTDFSSPEVLNHDKTVVTPHLGGTTEEAEVNGAKQAARTLRKYLETGNIVNSVNFPTVEMPFEAPLRLTLIHQNIPNMVGRITTILANREINIDNMINRSRDKIGYTVIDAAALSEEQVEELVKELMTIPEVIRVRALHNHA